MQENALIERLLAVTLHPGKATSDAVAPVSYLENLAQVGMQGHFCALGWRDHQITGITIIEGSHQSQMSQNVSPTSSRCDRNTECMIKTLQASLLARGTPDLLPYMTLPSLCTFRS